MHGTTLKVYIIIGFDIHWQSWSAIPANNITSEPTAKQYLAWLKKKNLNYNQLQIVESSVTI